MFDEDLLAAFWWTFFLQMFSENCSGQKDIRIASTLWEKHLLEIPWKNNCLIKLTTPLQIFYDLCWINIIVILKGIGGADCIRLKDL